MMWEHPEPLELLKSIAVCTGLVFAWVLWRLYSDAMETRLVWVEVLDSGPDGRSRFLIIVNRRVRLFGERRNMVICTHGSTAWWADGVRLATSEALRWRRAAVAFVDSGEARAAERSQAALDAIDEATRRYGQ